MNISEIYQSPYIKSSDLTGRGAIKLKIHEIEVKLFQDQQTGQQTRKVVLTFAGPDGLPVPKKLPLNRTQATALANAYGGEISTWTGKPIILAAGVAPNGQGTVVVSPAPAEIVNDGDIPF